MKELIPYRLGERDNFIAIPAVGADYKLLNPINTTLNPKQRAGQIA